VTTPLPGFIERSLFVQSGLHAGRFAQKLLSLLRAFSPQQTQQL